MQINKVQNDVSFGAIQKKAQRQLEKFNFIENSINKDVFNRLKNDDYIDMNYNGDDFVLTYGAKASDLDGAKQINAKGGFEFSPFEVVGSTFVAIYEVMADNARRNDYNSVQKDESSSKKDKARAEEAKQGIKSVLNKYTNQEKALMLLAFDRKLHELFVPIEKHADTFKVVG